MDTFDSIVQCLMDGEVEKIQELVHAALAEGISVGNILNHGLVPGMDIVGEKFKKEEFFLPVVLFSARAMHSAMYIIEPLLVGEGIKPIGKVVLGSVKGDSHDIGKNLVGMMLKGAGFQIVDIGTDVSPGKFVEAAMDDVQIIGMSALLSTTMPNMKITIDALEEAGLRDKVKIMIGGAIVTQDFADSIGADGYAPEASSALEWVKKAIAGS